MKNALILHGTLGSPEGNWFSWLKEELEKEGYKVWLPELPNSEVPNLEKYNELIFSNKDWEFNEESVIIGHSSGAVAILALLSKLPEEIVINKCILVAYFEKHSIGGNWEPNKELFNYNFDLEKIKKHSKEFIIIHSDNDPYSPQSGAENLAEKLGGRLIIKKGQGHFNLEMGKQYKEFPLLLSFL